MDRCVSGKQSNNLFTWSRLIVVDQSTPRRAVIFANPMVTLQVNKCTVFYASRRFIIMFTKSRQWNVSWSNWIQVKFLHILFHFTTPSTFLLRSILTWPSPVHLNLPNSILLASFSNKVCTFQTSSYVMHVSYNTVP